jgi:hypothetical protein
MPGREGRVAIDIDHGRGGHAAGQVHILMMGSWRIPLFHLSGACATPG